MTHILSTLATLFLASAAQQTGDLFNSVGKGLTKEIVAIKHPIDETITTIGSSQCSNVKKIFGMEYEQIVGDNGPDLNQLTLNFISLEYRLLYNLSAAAMLIPQSREYNPRKNLVIFVHGFTDDPTKGSFTAIREAFVRNGEYNILALDASSLIHWLYLRSSTYVRFIGARLGEVLAAAVNSGMNPSSIHLIGHSLGSHISSFAGKTFTALTGLRVGRISGLDPAGPCFSHIDPELRLKQTDAEFVDVIHTDAGVYGLKEPIGHVDFYPNGGSQQPNCLFQTCSHSRVWLLYAESVTNPAAFQAIKCDSWDAFRKGQCYDDVSIMGYGCLPGARGVYFLRTGEDPPYGLGQAGTVYQNNEGIIQNVGNILG